MADTTALWSLVGETTTLADLANETRPTLNSAGSWATNSLAAVWAARIRLGCTSSDIIDSDTSSATITVARSSGSLASVEGRAIANASTSRASSRATAGACRRTLPMPPGATARRSSTLENRTATDRRRRWRQT